MYRTYPSPEHRVVERVTIPPAHRCAILRRRSGVAARSLNEQNRRCRVRELPEWSSPPDANTAFTASSCRQIAGQWLLPRLRIGTPSCTSPVARTIDLIQRLRRVVLRLGADQQVAPRSRSLLLSLAHLAPLERPRRERPEAPNWASQRPSFLAEMKRTVSSPLRPSRPCPDLGDETVFVALIEGGDLADRAAISPPQPCRLPSRRPGGMRKGRSSRRASPPTARRRPRDDLPPNARLGCRSYACALIDMHRALVKKLISPSIAATTFRSILRPGAPGRHPPFPRRAAPRSPPPWANAFSNLSTVASGNRVAPATDVAFS